MLENLILVNFMVIAMVVVIISWLNIRPFGVLFTILLSLWLYKIRCKATLKIAIPYVINKKLEDCYNHFIEFRKERPIVFCITMCGILGIFALIGHLAAGSTVVLIGLSIAALLSTKYNFKILRIDDKDFVWQQSTDLDLDEFLPEINETNLFLLKTASEQANILSTPDDDEISEEVPSELMIPDSIPEVDENTDSSENDDILLNTSIEQKLTESIQFKRAHFKKDSSFSTSSSDEENITLGLDFQKIPVTEVNEVKENKYSITDKKGLPNLVKNINAELLCGFDFKSRNIKHNKSGIKKENSDESDFEIISSEDLKFS